LSKKDESEVSLSLVERVVIAEESVETEGQKR
jgi:hypothetical protein